MKIKSKHEFNGCDAEQVWEKLLDIELLGSIIPDSKGLKKVGRNKYESWIPMTVKLKPTKVKVKTKVKITFELKKINKPKSFRLIANGKGLKADGTFRLREEKNVTTVNYQVDTPNLFGKKVKKALPKLFNKIEAQCR